MKKNRGKRVTINIVICILLVTLCACGRNEDNSVYGTTIGGLSDDELFALTDINMTHTILLVSNQIYDVGIEDQAAITCKVYYAFGDEVKNLGKIESMGTAYPISYDKSGIYAGDGHSVERYEIDEKKETLFLAEGVYEIFDENGNVTYCREKGGNTEFITEEDYLSAVNTYGKATPVHFAYGAADL